MFRDSFPKRIGREIQCCPYAGFCYYNSFVQPPFSPHPFCASPKDTPLLVKPFFKQHPFLYNCHGPHQPWLGISSKINLGVLSTPSIPVGFRLCAFNRPLACKYFFIVSRPHLDDRALCRQLRVALHHQIILHHGPLVMV